MQLKNLSLLTLSTVTILNAASGDSINLEQMSYRENNDRMKIDFTVIDFKKEIGTDYSLGINASYDVMSGGTPVWQANSGASEKVTGNSTDSRCLQAPNSCQNTQNNKELLSDGSASINNYSYKNTYVDDTRKAISTSLIKRTEQRDEISMGIAYSKEEDFKSLEVSAGYLFYLNNTKNDSISIGLSQQSNDAYHNRDNKWKDFSITNLQIGYSKIINKKFVVQSNYFASKQQGTLSSPYQTVIRYFNISEDSYNPIYNYFLSREKRPDTKTTQGISLDSVLRINPNFDIHNAYRFYVDSWGIVSNTFTSNAFIKINQNLVFTPLLRFYTQTQASFYKANDSKNNYFMKDSFASADERLSEFNGITYGLGLKYKVNQDIKLSLRATKQIQSFGLTMQWFSAGLQYSF